MIEGVVGPGFLSDIVIWDNIVITFFSSCSISPSKEYLPRKKGKIEESKYQILEKIFVSIAVRFHECNYSCFVSDLMFFL